MMAEETITVTDEVTGQKHKFPKGATPAEMKAAMAKYRGAADATKQVKKQSLMEKVKALPGQIWSGMKAPYEEEEPSWLMAIPRAGAAGFKQFAEDVVGTGRLVGRQLTPPFLRSEEEPSRLDVLKPVDLLTAGPVFGGIGRGVGEATYAASGSPAAAAGAEQAGMLASPFGVSKLAQQARKSGLVGKVARLMEQKPLPAPRPTMKTVEEAVQREYGTAGAPEEFGRRFRQKYYVEAEQMAKAEPQAVYREAHNQAAGIEVDPEEIIDFLPKSEAGIAASVAPLPGETMQARTAGVAKSMIQTEEEAFEETSAKLSTGGGGQRYSAADVARMGPDAQKAILGELLGAPAIEGKVFGEAGKEAGKVTKTPVPLSDLLHLHARVNGAIRAASGNDVATRSLSAFKKRLDGIIAAASPDAMKALTDADFLYATKVVPSFAKGGVLREMQYKDAAKIADSLVPAGKTELRPSGPHRRATLPRPIEEFLGKLTPQAQSNLRASWFANRMAEAAGDPEKLVKILNKYSSGTLEKFLGPQFGGIKQLAETAARLKPLTSHWSFKRGLGGALGASTVFQLSYAIKDAIEAVVFGTSRGTPYAVLGAGHAIAATAGIMMANPRVFAKVATSSTKTANAMRQLLVMSYSNPNLPNVARDVALEMRKAQQELEAEGVQ